MNALHLQSSPIVYAPGIVRWAMNGYHFEDDRDMLLRVLVDTWSVAEATRPIIHRVLLGELPFRIEGETVVIEYEELVV